MMLNYDVLVKQENIELCYEGLHDTDLDVLINVIEQSTVLEGLELVNNKLTLSDGKLANAIAKNKTIKKLWLTYNKIGPEGAKHLADALKENINNALEVLYLGYNNIGYEGAKYLADMLSENKTLQNIRMMGNNIGDKGAESIAACLTKSTSLRTVGLRYNKIGDKGAGTLANALKSNHSIKELDLYGNYNISKDVMDRIEKILQYPKRNIANEEVKDTSKQDKQNKPNQSKALSNKRTRTEDTPITITKDEEIAKLRVKLTALEEIIRTKDDEIASLKESLKNSKPIDVVDLTDNTSYKRPRIEDTPKTSALAIQHEQNQQYSQRLVQVKQEKNDAETNLENVRVEKQAVEVNLKETRADLEDVREDLDIANETVTQVAVFTDRCQSKFDDLKALAVAAGVDGAAIAAIKNR